MDKLKLPVNSISQSGINRHSQKEYESIRKAITAGFFNHACRRDQKEGYR
jgi:hypothetical protein